MTEIEKTLNSFNVRPTAMRILIYKFLTERKIAVTLSDIENAFEKADRTTLYRTIKTFEENDIVHQIDDGTGITKYALCEQGCNCNIKTDLHLHFHCNNCNETVCLTEHKIPQIKVPEGYLAEDVNLVVKGICDKCSS
ncbi:Fur family ferric uptake transcriptional regulator [Mariniflexile fucanivorans]|uniref:Fur family ferric uptake transcriptional regulator n=1 Tax=Mariniflexile fucanivorans TaxID=264023 RepID=A0A4R1RJ40_9FLAO|nr:transcriptional repressor [Mariniflexile fucanivorans]TCL66026.1 Fur family ferric uptake transcriptional regulator [Mariniflexile fucanivorans]